MVRRVVTTAAVIMFVAAASSSAYAQASGGFDVQSFRPNPNQQTNPFGVASTRIHAAGEWEAGLVLHYSDDLLVVDSDLTDSRIEVVREQFVANFLVSFGVADRMELGFDFPVIWHQSGDATAAAGVDGSDAGLGVGDPRVVSKFLFVDQDTEESPGGIGLGAELDVYLPFANDDWLQGENLRLHPRVLFDYAIPQGTRVMTEVGYMLRTGGGEILDVEVDDMLTYGAGIDVPFGPDKGMHAIAELQGGVMVLADDLGGEEMPAEVRFGGRHVNERVHAGLGAGIGLNDAVGAPDWRVMLEFGVSSTEGAEE